jgi:hypothetical protein
MKVSFDSIVLKLMINLGMPLLNETKFDSVIVLIVSPRRNELGGRTKVISNPGEVIDTTKPKI